MPKKQPNSKDSLNQPSLGLTWRPIFVILIIAITIGSFISLTLLTEPDGILTQFGSQVLRQIAELRSPELNLFFRFITTLASVAVLLFLIAVLLVNTWKNNKNIAAIVAMALTVTLIISAVLKYTINRARPEALAHLVPVGTPSFPSGHTLQAAVMFGLMAYLLFYAFQSVFARVFVIVGAIFAIALVGFSRMYLGVHYPGDIVSSLLLGVAILTMLITLIELNQHYKWSPRMVVKTPPVRAIAVSIVAAIVFAAIFTAQITPLL